MHIPQGEFNKFAASLYRGFTGIEIHRDSIVLVQIVESFDNNLYDIIVGFRRDLDGLKVYQSASCFAYNNVQAEIEVAEAFRCILEARNTCFTGPSVAPVQKK